MGGTGSARSDGRHRMSPSGNARLLRRYEDYARFFACMNFFIFSMLLLVLAANLLLLFVGWEGVGLASYLLIGYYYNRKSAAEAATKAFVVNRIGDLGLLIGILLTFFTFRTSDIMQVIDKAGSQFTLGAPVLAALTLLYFAGATGESAQRSRSMCGCPMRWKAPHPSRP